jgi:hypothetical protein
MQEGDGKRPASPSQILAQSARRRVHRAVTRTAWEVGAWSASRWAEWSGLQEYADGLEGHNRWLVLEGLG